MVTFGASAIALADIVAVARRAAPVRLDASAGPRLAAARAVVDRALERGDAVYGLTTGLGAAVDTRLYASQIAAFQARAIRARAVGVGECMAPDEVRAMLAARLAGLCQAASGISPPLVDAVAALLNKGVTPRVRRIGSLGEADLSPLAQAFLPLIGDGEAEHDGVVLPGADAMAAAGLTPVTLGPKDALALLNSNAQSIGLATLALADLRTVLEVGLLAGALSLEGYRANLSPLDPDLSRMRRLDGHAAGVRALRAALDGSALFHPGTAPRVQDPISFRSFAPVFGCALRACDAAEAVAAAELNGVGDSPVVLPGRDAMLSSVNFDSTELALALEAAGLALSHLAAISAARITKLMSPGASGLPRFLTRHGGSHSGFATTQKTASALEAEIRHLAHPLGALTIPVADGVEDYAPMTPAIVDKLHAAVRRFARLVAIELVVAAQAVDLRESATLGHGAALAYGFVRAAVAPLDDDRPMGREYEALALRILDGELPWRLAPAGGAA